MSYSYQIRNTSNAAISLIEFGQTTDGAATSASTIRLYNDGDATPATMEVGALTSQLNVIGDRNDQGQEAVTEQWLEARVGAGAWTPIGGDPATAGNVLSVTPPTPGNYIDVQLRLNMPASPTTTGNFAVVPFATWPVE